MSLRKPSTESGSRLFSVKTSTLIISAILLAAFISIVSIAVSRTNSGGEGTAPTTNLFVGRAAPAAYRFVPGERMGYTLDYAGTAQSDFRVLLSGKSQPKEEAGPSPLARSFKTIVKAELIVTVVDKSPESIVIAYTLRSPVVNLRTDTQEATAATERIKADLSHEIFALIDLQGRVLSMRFDPGVSSLSRDLVRAVLSLTQFVFPSAPALDFRPWETQENDPNGAYIARYEKQGGPAKSTAQHAPGNCSMFRKSKVRYLQQRTKAKPDEFELTMTINPKGNMTACFDIGGGYLVSLEGSESQVFVAAGKTVANTETTFRMNYLRKEVLGEVELSALREANAAREKVARAIPLFAPRSKEEGRAAIRRAELGSATLESLLSDLAKAAESRSETYDETRLHLKFEALVYIHPESCATLGNILATAEPGSVTMRVLVGALSTVGHPEAQAALIAAIRARSNEWPALLMLIPALGSVRAPTQLAEDTLRDLAFHSSDWNISSTAQLALGAMARNLAEMPERAAKIVKLVIKEIDSSLSNDLTRQWLLVLGNAGSTLALPTVARFMNNPSSELRAAAASALRWIDSSQAENLLINALTSDPDATVRLEAAVALGFREMDAASYEGQKKTFLKDNALNVRLAVLKNLWRAREAFPEVRRFVKRAAANDASKDIRKATAGLMETEQAENKYR